MSYFDDYPIGEDEWLGAHAFTADEIIAFAAKYDPQPFHLSEEAARATHFGGLIASGWHTASWWMRFRVEANDRANAERAAKGLAPRHSGPSPGYKNLKWPKPVRPGDTVTYWCRGLSKRPLASRAGWGLIVSLNTGIDQTGDLVFSFEGTVLVATT